MFKRSHNTEQTNYFTPRNNASIINVKKKHVLKTKCEVLGVKVPFYILKNRR